MRILLIVLIAGAIIRWGFPIAMGSAPLKQRVWNGQTIQLATFGGGIEGGETTLTPSEPETRIADSCTWTCGSDPQNANACQGAVIRNGLVAKSESRTSGKGCDGVICSSLFSDFAADCPQFEAN